MKEYISTIIYICIFSVILELILPDNKLKKYVNVLVAIVVILTLISPVLNFLENEDVIQTVSSAVASIKSEVNIEEIEYDFEDYKNKMIFNNVKSNLEEELYTSLKKEFKNLIQISGVEIELNDEYKIDKVIVTTGEFENLEVAKKIINFLKEEYNITDNIIEVAEEK